MKIFISAGLWTETSHLGIHTRWTFLVENDGWGKLTTGKKDHNFLNYRMIDWWLLTAHSLPRFLERGSKKFCFLFGFLNKLQGKLVHHLTTNVSQTYETKKVIFSRKWNLVIVIALVTQKWRKKKNEFCSVSVCTTSSADGKYIIELPLLNHC